jgi:uncharacterized protein (DUF488 family)
LQVYSIGFAKKTAEVFFAMLEEAKVRLLVDVRLNNVSQLAGFTRSKDLEYFLRELCGCGYAHELMLAPTKEMFDAYRNKAISWEELEVAYRALLDDRRVADALDRSIVEGPAVFLCSEPAPERCHRRLALEYLQEKWGGFDIVHL